MNELQKSEAQTQDANGGSLQPAGYARPTLQDLLGYLLRLRDETAKVKHFSARGEIASAPICNNLVVIEAAITATITTVEAEIKAHNAELCSASDASASAIGSESNRKT